MFWNEIIRISNFIGESFLHIWPYLVVTIPLAVAVQMSGASKYIKRAFGAKPMTAIVLATVVGAFSPFCSCGVIPVIASLLISGVPRNRIPADQRGAPGTGDVVLDCLALHGSRDIFLECGDDRMGIGGLAPGRHPVIEFFGRSDHPGADGQRLAGRADSAIAPI